MALTRAMSLDLAEDYIRVNAVLPGATDTHMLRSGLSRGHVKSGDINYKLKQLIERHPLKRIGKPEEIAEAIYFLADNKMSSFITGQSLVVDGGATARLSTE
jgi:glucose 1-dehydrogenase